MKLKDKLRNRQFTVGTWLTISSPEISDIVSKTGVDWITLDMEHSPLDMQNIAECIRIIELNNIPSFVRMTSNDENDIKRALDAGASGIIVPMVNSAQDVKKIVDSVYYPPKGRRGVGLSRAQEYGAPGGFARYRQKLEEEISIVVIIENIKAIENLDEIFSIPEVDAFILGPYDLSASLGIPGELEHEKMLSIIEKVAQKADDHNLAGGLHIVEPDPEIMKKYTKMGFRFFAYSVDFRIIDHHYREGISKIKEANL